MTTPADIRDDNFRRIEAKLTGDRLRVHRALLLYGPCTTMALAARSGITIFSVRPRVTELCDLGLAELHGRAGREGIYRALTCEEAQRRYHAAQTADNHPCQLDLL